MNLNQMQPTYTQFQDLTGKYDALLQKYNQLVQRVSNTESRINGCELFSNRSLFEREILWTLGKISFLVTMPVTVFNAVYYFYPEAKRFINTDMDVYICIFLYLMLMVGFGVLMFTKPA